MIKNENYYTIFGWMLRELNLSGVNLVVYAIIYSFSQDGESEFKGSLAYIAEFTGASERTIRRSLRHLEDMGYIEMSERNQSAGIANSYRSIVDLNRLSEIGKQNDRPLPEEQRGADKMTAPGGQNVRGDGQNDRPIININRNTSYRERKKESIKKEASSKFEEMSDEELLDWGHNPIDLSDPQQEAEFYAWNDECQRRKADAKQWDGKIIKTQTNFERLESHEEVMERMGVDPLLKDAFRELLRNSYANGHLVVNAQLEDMIIRLDERFERDEESKIKTVKRAAAGGWYDINEWLTPLKV